MLQLGKKLKQGLVLIMATLTLPSAHSMNAVYPIAMPTATSSEYYTKTVNLKETAGSFLAEATMLVYDEILRYQRDVEFTHGLDEAAIAAFDYDAFAGNVKWLMDELVGVESDWKKDASPGIEGNTAYGYVQFTEASVATAVERYSYHIRKFNSRSILGRRDWQPRGYINSDKLIGGTKMHLPQWLWDLKNKTQPEEILGVTIGGGYDHKNDLDALTILKKNTDG